MTATHGPITCSEAVRQLWDYLDRVISVEDRERNTQLHRDNMS